MILTAVEDIKVGDWVGYGGWVTETLDGGAQIRLTFKSGADAIFQRGSSLSVEERLDAGNES